MFCLCLLNVFLFQIKNCGTQLTLKLNDNKELISFYGIEKAFNSAKVEKAVGPDHAAELLKLVEKTVTSAWHRDCSNALKI